MRRHRAPRGATLERKSGIERRSHERVPTQIRTTIARPGGAVVATGIVRDMSMGGVFIEIDGTAPDAVFDSTIILDMVLPVAPFSMRFLGVAIWSTAEGPDAAASQSGFGVELIDMSGTQTEQLSAVLRQLKAKA